MSLTGLIIFGICLFGALFLCAYFVLIKPASQKLDVWLRQQEQRLEKDNNKGKR